MGWEEKLSDSLTFFFSFAPLRPFAAKVWSEKKTFLEGAEGYALEGMKRRVVRIADSGLLPNILGQDVSGVFLQQYRWEEGGKGREGKGREGKGREGKGREGKGREGKGRKGGN